MNRPPCTTSHNRFPLLSSFEPLVCHSPGSNSRPRDREAPVYLHVGSQSPTSNAKDEILMFINSCSGEGCLQVRLCTEHPPRARNATSADDFFYTLLNHASFNSFALSPVAHYYKNICTHAHGEYNHKARTNTMYFSPSVSNRFQFIFFTQLKKEIPFRYRSQ